MVKEIRDLYDKNKKVTGKTFIKGEQVPKGYFYLIVIIIITNSDGKYLIQKRVERKSGKWALTGGHPKAGETSQKGIIEEVKEELGIDIANDKITLFKTITHNDQFFDLYYLNKNISIDDIHMQDEEVVDVKWATKDEIIDMFNNNLFHEEHFKIFNEYLKYKGENENIY